MAARNGHAGFGWCSKSLGMHGPGRTAAFLVFLIVFVVIRVVFLVVFQKIAVFVKVVAFGVFLIFVLFFFDLIGNGVQRHGMRLRHLQFAFALWTAQDFSLFHFV